MLASAVQAQQYLKLYSLGVVARDLILKTITDTRKKPTIIKRPTLQQSINLAEVLKLQLR